MKFASAFVSLIFSLTGLSALAAENTTKEVMTCAVEASNSTVTMSINVIADSSADFVLVLVKDKDQQFRMFTQLSKDEVATSIQNGSFAVLLLDESFKQEMGVIRNAGILVIRKGDTGNFSGLLSAHGNVYPLTCIPK